MLDYIHCSGCDKTFLVGIHGKDIIGKGSGGMLDDTPYMAIGNDEVANAKDVKESYPCPLCDKECKTEHAGGD